MVDFIMKTLGVLLAELAGVGVTTGILYVYWKVMTRKKEC